MKVYRSLTSRPPKAGGQRPPIKGNQGHGAAHPPRMQSTPQSTTPERTAGRNRQSGAHRTRNGGEVKGRTGTTNDPERTETDKSPTPKKGGGRRALTEWEGRRRGDGRAREGGARPKITPEDEQPPPRGGWVSEGEHRMHNAEGVREAAAGSPRRPLKCGGIMQAGRVRGRERRRPQYQAL